MKQYFRHCFDMKVQMWRPFVVMALCGLIITACTDSADNPDNPGEEITTGDDASDKMPFKVTQTVVNVIRPSSSTQRLVSPI